MRRRFVLVLLFVAAGANAHDLITADSAQQYLDNAALWYEQSTAAAEQSERAMAHLNIGTMLDEIRDLLNRDLAAHGAVQGLASNYLVAELKSVGTPLAFSDRRQYFISNSAHYRSALRIGLDEGLATSARLRLLRGEFYDSFGSDPLHTVQTDEQLQEQLVLADTLLGNVESEPELEEVRFIATIVYARAAQSAADPASRSQFRDKALATADAFERAYPGSLRSVAMPVVRESLSSLQ